MLCDYCWRCDLRRFTPVKTVLAGTDGTFDFGFLRPGHYYLKIDDEQNSLAESSEVEMNGPPNQEESQIIDISPVYPDCNAGHEFIESVNWAIPICDR
jgi:hypothetical protein